MKLTSLGELSKELGILKTTLQFWYNQGLFKEVATVGRMRVFDYDTTVEIIKKKINKND